MSLTVYNMPDGNIFNSRAEISEYYNIPFEGPDDTEKNVETVIEACKVLAAKHAYTKETIKLIEAGLFAYDVLIKLGKPNEQNTHLEYDLTDDITLRAFKVSGISPMKSMPIETDEEDHVRKDIKAELLLVKIALDEDLTEEEQKTWEDYKLFMHGRDPEEGFDNV